MLQKEFFRVLRLAFHMVR